MSRNDSWHRKFSIGQHFQNGRHNTAQIQHCSISTSWIDSRHWKISSGCHFQNDRHNTAQIQHCPISTPFHMWVDYDVPDWFLTSKKFYQSPFSKWQPQYRTNSTLFDFNVLIWFPISKNFYWSPQYRRKFNIVRFQR